MLTACFFSLSDNFSPGAICVEPEDRGPEFIITNCWHQDLFGEIDVVEFGLLTHRTLIGIAKMQ